MNILKGIKGEARQTAASMLKGGWASFLLRTQRGKQVPWEGTRHMCENNFPNKVHQGPKVGQGTMVLQRVFVF